MENIINRIGNLITVKSITTILLAVVFSVLALRGSVSADQFLTVFTIIIGFYFGTQRVDDTSNKK